MCIDTVWKHLRSDPAFAEGYDSALGTGHQILRAEMVARQREAQEAYKIAPDPDAVAAAAAEDFERNLKLLESWQRRDDSLARRAAKAGGRQAWQELPPIEEVRERIIQRVEAIKRHRRRQEERQALEGGGDSGCRGSEEPTP